jgi:hypothetical protein
MKRALVYALCTWIAVSILFSLVAPLIAPPGADLRAAGARVSQLALMTIVPLAFVGGLLHQKAIDKRR